MVDFVHVGLDPEASLPNGASLTPDTTNNRFDLAGLYQATDIFQVLLGLRFTDFEPEGTSPGVDSRIGF